MSGLGQQFFGNGIWSQEGIEMDQFNGKRVDEFDALKGQEPSGRHWYMIRNQPTTPLQQFRLSFIIDRKVSGQALTSFLKICSCLVTSQGKATKLANHI